MLSVDGDVDAAVEARIRIGWNKFRQLVPLLTNKDVSLIMRERLYSAKHHVAWKRLPRDKMFTTNRLSDL